jgi:hypothetical protein
MALEPTLFTLAMAFLAVTGTLIVFVSAFVFSGDPGRRERAREAARDLALLLRHLIRPPR